MTRVQDIVPKYDRVYLIGRLTPKYSVTEDIFSCWLWLGTTDSKGYGLIEVGTMMPPSEDLCA